MGARKTEIDTCLWLLANGVDPVRITWIVPRDSWFSPRGFLQPGPAFTQNNAANLEATNQSIVAATSAEDMFSRLESCAQLMRLDGDVWPSMWRCATTTHAELDQLQKIKTIVRKGRVVRLDTAQVTLEKGTYAPVSDTLYIDCSADALAKRTAVPVFGGKYITLQPVRYCQQASSAASITHVEATYDDERFKNDLCRVVPHSNDAMDYLITLVQTHRNGLRWMAEPKTSTWLARARLDWLSSLLPPPPQDSQQQALCIAQLRAGDGGYLCKTRTAPWATS